MYVLTNFYKVAVLIIAYFLWPNFKNYIFLYILIPFLIALFFFFRAKLKIKPFFYKKLKLYKDKGDFLAFFSPFLDEFREQPVQELLSVHGAREQLPGPECFLDLLVELLPLHAFDLEAEVNRLLEDIGQPERRVSR